MKAFLLTVMLAAACNPALSPDKDGCRDQSDCLSGYTCVNAACTAPAAAPQTAPTTTPQTTSTPPPATTPPATSTGGISPVMPSFPITKLVDNAIFAAVDTRGEYVAYYTNALANASAQSGTLSVLDVGSGASTPLAANAYDATFTAQSDTLEFWTDFTPSVDAGSTASFGAMHIFSPVMGAAARLSTGFAVRHVGPPERAFELVFDVAQPSLAQPGALVLHVLATCNAVTCSGQTIESNVLVTDLAVSSQDEFAAYRVKVTSGATVTYETYLLDIRSATSTLVSSAATEFLGPTLAFSPDGSLLATIATVSGEPQLRVISTASHKVVPWAAPTSGAPEELTFIDNQSLVVRSGTAQTDDGIYRVSATAATPLVPSAQGYVLVGGRYLYVATNKTPYALTLIDLDAFTPAPVTFTSDGAGYPVSDDNGDTALFIDQFDSTTKSGVLTAVSAATGTLTAIASPIFTGNYRFFPSGAELLYIADASADTVGTLHMWSAGVDTVIATNVYSFAGSALDSVYFDVTTTDTSVAPARTPGVYMTTLAR